MMSIRLGQTARDVRKSLGLSQREAAEKLGITAVHLCNVEHDGSNPSKGLINRYSELFGVDLIVRYTAGTMDKHQFCAAFGAIHLAVQVPNVKKPKSLLHATRGFRQGTGGKPRHIEQLSQMTLQQLFDLRYELEGAATEKHG